MPKNVKLLLEIELDQPLTNIGNLKAFIAEAVHTWQHCSSSSTCNLNDPLCVGVSVIGISDPIDNTTIEIRSVPEYEHYSIYSEPDLIKEILKLDLTPSQRTAVYNRAEYNDVKFCDFVAEIKKNVNFVRSQPLKKRQIHHVIERICFDFYEKPFEELLNHYLSENKNPEQP